MVTDVHAGNVAVTPSWGPQPARCRPDYRAERFRDRRRRPTAPPADHAEVTPSRTAETSDASERRHTYTNPSTRMAPTSIR